MNCNKKGTASGELSPAECLALTELFAPTARPPQSTPHETPEFSQEDFLQWEMRARGLDYKVEYVDIADGNIKAGLLLGQIVFWFLPDKKGESKIEIYREGKIWIAKQKTIWYQETRLQEWAFTHALQHLLDAGICEKQTWHFNRQRTLHVTLNLEVFLDKLAVVIAHLEDE